MIPALLIIDEKLKEAGMSQVEIDHLMARFLEEEAFDFVECVKSVQDYYEISKDEIIH